MCDCKVGPGKFEGESAETAMLWEWSMEGFGEIHGPEGCTFDYFDGEVLVGSEDREAAVSAGFCVECIDAATKRLRECKGAVVGQTEQGFIWSRIADTDDEHVKMLADIAADDAEAEADEADDDEA